MTVLLAFACGDDVPQDPAGSSSSGTGPDTTTAPTPATGSGVTTDESSTGIEPTTTGLDSSTGPATECGNGMVEADEACDDNNVMNDDDCYSDCTIPYEILWTETEDAGDIDFADHALFDAEGNLYVLGSTQVAGQGYDLWLRQYLPDGSEGWTYTYNDDVENQDEIGRHLSWHSSGDLLIVGRTETTATEDDILVMRLGIDDQVPVWMDVYVGPGTGPEPIDQADFGNGIVGAANGDVLVAGTQRVDGQEYDTWLRRYDGDGVELWTQTYNNMMFNGSEFSDSVLEDSTGDIYLVGSTEVSQSTFELWVRKMDSAGVEIWTQQVANMTSTEARIDPMDNLVIVGVERDNPNNANMWIAKYDPDFSVIASTQYDGPSGAFDIARGVAIDADGGIYVGGMVTIIGEQGNLWVGRYPSDLQLRWWSDSYGNEESNLADNANSVAVSDDGSRVAVVGSESVIGQDTNIWVRMYQNNATPM